MSATKKKKKKSTKKKAARKGALQKKFSASQPAGTPVKTCPLKCNLKTLKISEPKGGDEEKTISRAIELHPELKETNRKGNPVLSPSGSKFQITANSRLAKEPRELKLSLVTEAQCSGGKHPHLSWKDFTEDKSIVGKSGEMKFFRQDLPCDRAPGIFSILNAIFTTGSSRIYPVRAESCGNPKDPQGLPVPQIVGVVEVFPADVFEAEIEFPSPKKIDGPEKKSSNWTTDRDKQDEEIKKEGEEAKEAYKASDPKLRGAWGTQSEYQKGWEDKKKGELGYKDREPEGSKFKVTQKDGPRTITADPKDAIALYDFVRQTEKAIKKVDEWIEDIQIGPGASFKIDIELFVMSLKAEWGIKEYQDERVYLSIKGTAAVEFIKGSIEAFFGFRAAGLADALVFLKGEGSIKLQASVSRESPEIELKPDVNLSGEFKISGGVQGQAMWVVKVEGKVQVGFSVEADHLSVFTNHGLFKGEWNLKRSAVQLVMTASFWRIGSSGRSYELVKKGDLGPFKFGD